ncbi:MAG: ribosome silencing factor [Christensenellales bacterium]
MKEALQRAREIAEILYEKGADKIRIIDIADMTVIADCFVVCSGRSAVQVKALCDAVEDKMEEKEVLPARKEGYRPGRWIVLDYLDVLVHIFHEEERAFYDIERLWSSGQNCFDYPEEA